MPNSFTHQRLIVKTRNDVQCERAAQTVLLTYRRSSLLSSLALRVCLKALSLGERGFGTRATLPYSAQKVFQTCRNGISIKEATSTGSGLVSK